MSEPASTSNDAPAAARVAGETFGVETVGMTKIFGSFVALGDVSIRVAPGTLHALLGENGAGKSTLVKCMMGFYTPTSGQLIVGEHEAEIASPRDAMAQGLGMVYQHFTLAPSLTAAENLVVSRGDDAKVINWKREMEALDAFMARMPFKVPLRTPVASLSAGEKQKLEILKQLYLDRRFVILDEPTSVLTPDEADEILSLLRGMTQAQKLTILMISHKFREVTAYADEVSVLRRGRYVGGGKVGEMSTQEMARLMIGDATLRPRAARAELGEGRMVLATRGLKASNDQGIEAVKGVDLEVRSGEIVGVAGVSGNGQSTLVEVLSGQRDPSAGKIEVDGEPYTPVRAQMKAHNVHSLQEEPLRNSAAPKMSVAANMALRSFDQAPIDIGRGVISLKAMRARARDLITRYNVKTRGPDTPIEALSGGNVQRAILARELSTTPNLLIVANPCFGLDFASVADIRGQILEARNQGAAVLLVSEDLDEILELADRVAVMSAGRFSMVKPMAETSRAEIGQAMAGEDH